MGVGVHESELGLGLVLLVFGQRSVDGGEV
jgi:hypothetical protein